MEQRTFETFGSMVAELRREKGMTQSELAEKMHVTDKAVSKWERDLSFPDAHSLPRLAEIFNVTVDELMRASVRTAKPASGSKIAEIVSLAFKGVALAMGIAVVLLSIMRKLDVQPAISMLGIGLACLALAQFKKEDC